ncbi:YkvA family protein [Azohydromonas aeria]|uniref:YkvA family protein n=1 Tax=Azohydromonas aeria TaxID=2590212 RepID=UPI0012F778A8|nr:YkvA family protein [Azohydromonas aeria]
MNLLQAGRAWARRIKRDVMTLWFARKHPRTPWHAKALGVLVVAYALSPIDLIPDFIPVLGYLDDVILLPALIWLAVRLLPTDVLAQCRAQAEQWLLEARARPRSRAGAVAIVALWIVLGLLLGAWLYGRGWTARHG